MGRCVRLLSRIAVAAIPLWTYLIVLFFTEKHRSYRPGFAPAWMHLPQKHQSGDS
jgi:hypothetical protein